MQGRASVFVGDWPNSLTGEGELAIDEGRLIDVAVVGDLMSELKVVTSEDSNTDRGTCHWFLRPDQVLMRDIDMECRACATDGD